jgi:hypothetical protein
VLVRGGLGCFSNYVNFPLSFVRYIRKPEVTTESWQTERSEYLGDSALAHKLLKKINGEGEHLLALEVAEVILVERKFDEFALEDWFGAHRLDFLRSFQCSADEGGEAEVLLLDGGGVRLEEFAHLVDDPRGGEGENYGDAEHDPDTVESENGEDCWPGGETEQCLVDREADDRDGNDLKHRLDEKAAQCSGHLVGVLVNDHGQPVGVILVEETGWLTEELGEKIGFHAVGDRAVELGDEELKSEFSDQEGDGEADPEAVGGEEVETADGGGVCRTASGCEVVGQLAHEDRRLLWQNRLNKKVADDIGDDHADMSFEVGASEFSQYGKLKVSCTIGSTTRR